MTWQIPTGTSAIVWAVLLVLALPLLTIAVSLKLSTGSLLGGGRPLIFGTYAVVVMVGVGLLASMLVNKVVVQDDEIRLRGSFYNRSLDRGDIDPASVQVFAAGGRPELTLRTNGIGLPGYQAGWFRDRQGGKVFVVYGGGPGIAFRTRDGIGHVIGVADPEAASRALAGAG